MLKLIDKIPENIPEKKIERFSTRYTGANAVMIMSAPPEQHLGLGAIYCRVFEDLLEKFYNIEKSFKYSNIGNMSIVEEGDLDKFNRFYHIEKYPFFIPKNWIDGKKEIFIYHDKKDIYFHIKLQEYLEMMTIFSSSLLEYD